MNQRLLHRQVAAGALRAALFALGLSSAGMQAQDIPPSLAGQYAASPAQSLSDEFNDTVLDSAKWAYRTQGRHWGTGPEYVAFVEEDGDRFVSIRGKWAERNGSGIVTKAQAHFGFYAIRWRTEGISPKWKTPWHPAIWMAAQNCATGDDARSIPRTARNVEIDFVEYWHQPLWHSQTIAWDRSRPKGTKPLDQKLRPTNKDFATTKTGWQVHGLEYHPDHLQLWQKVQGRWQPIGRRVPITDQPTSHDSLNEAYATPGYWILSNKQHWEIVSRVYKGKPDRSRFRFADSSLDVDYFRYYPLK